MNELDAYQCAKLLLDQHGSGAELHAAMRADAMEAAGDEGGRRAWLQILAAMDELRRTERRLDEAIQEPQTSTLCLDRSVPAPAVHASLPHKKFVGLFAPARLMAAQHHGPVQLDILRIWLLWAQRDSITRRPISVARRIRS